MPPNSISVPEQYRHGLTQLARLSAELAEQLNRTIRELPPSLYTFTMVDQINVQVPGIGRDVVEPIVNALLSVFSASDALEMPLQQVSREIAQSVDLDLSTEERVALADRLVRLTEPYAMMVTSKALSLLVEFERSFHDARIVSDIRPVFTRDPSQSPQAAMIVHTLVISVHGQEPLRKIHVAMDSEDLQTLKAVIDRALSKARSIEDLLRRATVHVLNPADKHD